MHDKAMHDNFIYLVNITFVTFSAHTIELFTAFGAV